jgi:hypothetical protein
VITREFWPSRSGTRPRDQQVMSKDIICENLVSTYRHRLGYKTGQGGLTYIRVLISKHVAIAQILEKGLAQQGSPDGGTKTQKTCRSPVRNAMTPPHQTSHHRCENHINPIENAKGTPRPAFQRAVCQMLRCKKVFFQNKCKETNKHGVSRSNSNIRILN